jgi:anaerobic ribonucleoside-triphosphate reductase
LKGSFVAAKETTDITLFVRTSDEEVAHWDRKRIVDALMLETYVDLDTAEAISLDVERQIMASGLTYLTAPLIRELVDAKLTERGLEQARRMHARLGFPLYDVSQLILHQNKENANLPHGPEASNLILAEGIKKEYALHGVFSHDVGDAHVRGDLHLHDLGYVDRPYSSSQTLEFVKKFGLSLPNTFSASKPARHAEVLLAHMVRYSAVLQGYFSGTIGWDAVNVFFAPYLEKLSDREIEQIAQMLVFEFSQLAVSRGGQAIFTEIGIYWEIPRHLRDVPAIGPGGELTGKTYGHYAKDAQRFARALFEIYRKGDALGSPFFFPKPLLRITEDFFTTPGHEDFLLHVCGVAAEKGNPHFIFDRNRTLKVLRCLSLDFENDGQARKESQKPWEMRYASIQNVTLNLPRLGYLAEGNDAHLFSLLSERMEIVARAHVQKRQFIERLLAIGDGGPLALLSMDCAGSAYLKLDRATYLIGMVGLNELVQIHRGAQLHEDDKAMKFGLKILGSTACGSFSSRPLPRAPPTGSPGWISSTTRPSPGVLSGAISQEESFTTRTRRSSTSPPKRTPSVGSRARASSIPSSTAMPSRRSGLASLGLPPRHLPDLPRRSFAKQRAARSSSRPNSQSVPPASRRYAVSRRPAPAAAPPE